jgi:hypothetical protein
LVEELGERVQFVETGERVFFFFEGNWGESGRW